MQEHDHVSEAIERKALISLHENCPQATREKLGLFMVEVGDSIVCGATHEPSILINRTLGLGTQEPITRDVVESIAAVYKEHGVPRYFMHVYPQTLPDGPSVIEGTGLASARGWMKFYRGDAPPEPKRESSLEVRRVDSSQASDFGRIIATAFGMTPAAGPLLAGLADDPRWHCFVSYDGDKAAGAGGLMIDGRAAWFEWGATDPEFRRRGSQGRIMVARLQAALTNECSMMFTETGEALGDDPQHSYGNIQRYGFRESVLRNNWAPAS